MTTSEDVLRVARTQIGYKEKANNNNKYGAWYGLNNKPWCAMFVSWVANEAKATTIIPKHAYTPAGAAWFKSKKQWHTSPRVGDIVYFNFPNDDVDRISHVGIVEAVMKDGSIVTIEGNTNKAGSRVGGGVWRKIRKTGVVGYGRPNYKIVKPVVVAKPKPKPVKKTNAVIANEVIHGLWGTGTVRKNRLKKAGYDPAVIQKLVNKKIK
jgi:surface antigen